MAILISVIVPVFRQWAELDDFLAKWEQHTSDMNDVELIIVDNEPQADHPTPQFHDKVRLIACTKPGAYAARNAGAAVAKGTLLVFTDSDCRPEPQWLGELRAAHTAWPDRLLGGNVKMVIDGPETWWATYDKIRGIPQAHYATRGYGATANLAVPAQFFHNFGGFDDTRLSGGDAEFCRRVGRHGAQLMFVENAIVRHPARSTWQELKTKSRRIKGAQLLGGTVQERRYWLLRTLLPPLPEIARLTRSSHTLDDRTKALLVRLALWGVELGETFRLLIWKTPAERC